MTHLFASNVDGSTRLMGLIGQDISYSLSPLLHNRAAIQLRENIVYLPLSLPKSQIRNFLEVAWHLGATGFNVTKPYKGYLANLVDCQGRRSLNTLYRGEEGWCGASTDGPGFARAIERLGRTLGSFERLVLLGNGGAAFAIMEHLLEMHKDGEKCPRRITVLRRNNTADGSLEAFSQQGFTIRIQDLSPESLALELEGAASETLCVQATSAPLEGDSMSHYVGSLDRYQGVFIDLVYGQPSALYFRALALDLVAQDGESMLIEQARLSQQIWWGKCALYDEMALALRRK
jgi:shikimate dehydrogenase